MLLSHVGCQQHYSFQLDGLDIVAPDTLFIITAVSVGMGLQSSRSKQHFNNKLCNLPSTN